MLKPAQARMARAALGWNLVKTQEKTGINKNTIVRFEAGKGILLTTASRLEEAFVKEGITFLYEEPGRGSGLLLSNDLSRRLGEGPASRPKTKPAKAK